MGEMDGFFKLGNNFMYLFPCFVALFCLCTMFNVWGRTARSSFMKNLFKKYDQLFLYSSSSLLTVSPSLRTGIYSTLSCWPIKKLKIHIEDPRNLAEEGATILRRGMNSHSILLLSFNIFNLFMQKEKQERRTTLVFLLIQLAIFQMYAISTSPLPQYSIPLVWCSLRSSISFSYIVVVVVLLCVVFCW